MTDIAGVRLGHAAAGALPAGAALIALLVVAPAASAQGAAANGQQLFTQNCAVCHQATGLGIPNAFPPLKGDAAVNDADPSVHIHTVLHGLQGVVIAGVKYAAPMPEFGSHLSDAEIAAIINYERTSWGNSGAQVTAQQVAAERAKGK
jgi:cytochrome c oxidase cbb3-type subunit 2